MIYYFDKVVDYSSFMFDEMLVVATYQRNEENLIEFCQLSLAVSTAF